MRRRGWRPSSRNANRVSRTADPRIADSRLLRRVPDMATVFDRLDATLELPEHEAMVLESVSQLARDVVAPRAADYDRREACPVENIEAMNALGMNAMFVPEAYGGLGPGYPVSLPFVPALSQEDRNASWWEK